ncbi:uncharacterized protein METZ01_LOCUS94164 [marine metagenome]|uniref:Uncharacterized protein n=1 Tax=marine metagenome TaxID=408172 RepID=A0A381VLY1_9ZZZZ
MARADFDPTDAVDFWNTTNGQDWRVSELAPWGFLQLRIALDRTPTLRTCSTRSTGLSSKGTSLILNDSFSG